METSKEEKYIDATKLPPATKHATIFGMFDQLQEGESFILHNDHDPLPLKYQMTATHGDVFSWDYLKKGPEVWELRITRKINYLKRAIATAEDGEKILDATQLPPAIKHDTIIGMFDHLKVGESFVLHNDHDPVPLRYQLEALRGETFSWDYVMAGPDGYEIRIEKQPDPSQKAFSKNEKGETVLNAPDLSPAIKHNKILETFEDLKEGTSFILRNDHDPKPLQYQFQSFFGDSFTWDYLKQGPVFEIRIGKKAKKVEDAITRNAKGQLVLDGLKLPREEQNSTIFRTFDELKDGESFILHLDHNGQPLNFQMGAMRGKGKFDWKYLKKEEGDFEIQITKTLDPKNNFFVQEDNKKEQKEELFLDANKLPPATKHETIIETFDQLGGGESFVLHVDHDPKPLYYQLEATRGGDTFTWDYLQQGPDIYEVRIAKK